MDRRQRGIWTMERVWEHIAWYGKGGDECWEWSGPTKQYDYGRIRVRSSNGYKSFLVSRIIACDAGLLKNLKYEGHGSGTTIRHRCDNPRCCNPNHLEVGTQSDNVHDTGKRGRRRDKKGSETSLAKLKEEDIPLIRRLHLEMLMTKKDIAKLFNVSDVAIFCIISGKTWRHV